MYGNSVFMKLGNQGMKSPIFGMKWTIKAYFIFFFALVPSIGVR